MKDELNKTKGSITTEYDDSFILSQLIGTGKITKDDVEEVVKTSKLEEEVKELHKGKIYQDDRGRWCAYVRITQNGKKKYRQIAKTHKKDLLAELYKFYTDEEYTLQSKITVAQLFPKWLNHKEKHTNSKGTIERFKIDWKKYYKDTEIANRCVTSLTRLYLDEWACDKIKEYNMTATQYSNMSTILRQMLDYAVALDLIERNIFDDVKIERHMFRRTHKKSSEEAVYSYEEQAKIFDMAWKDFKECDYRFKQPLTPLAIMFQFLTGLRVSELCAVRHEDVVDGKYINICRMVIRDTHEVIDGTKGTFGDRQVMLPTTAMQIIEIATKYKEEHGYQTDGYIFSVTDDYLTYRSVTDLYRKYCEKMGVKYKGSHGARKAYISALHDGQININTIREMAGHTDERTTLKHYTFDRHSKDERWEAINQAMSATVSAINVCDNFT